MTEHDAKGLEIIAGWLQRDGLIEPAAMLRRLAAGASEGKADDQPAAFLCEWGDTGRSVTIDKPEDLFCELPTKVTPLYLHPSADEYCKAYAEEWQDTLKEQSAEIAALRERIAGMEKDADMTYEQIAEKLSDDGYSKQADVIRQITKHAAKESEE